MNLSKLFEMQRKLDERIIEEKGLQGQNLLLATGNYTRKHWGDSLDQIHRARWKSSKT